MLLWASRHSFFYVANAWLCGKKEDNNTSRVLQDLLFLLQRQPGSCRLHILHCVAFNLTVVLENKQSWPTFWLHRQIHHHEVI